MSQKYFVHKIFKNLSNILVKKMNRFLRYYVVWYISYIIWWAFTVILKYFPLVAQEGYDDLVRRKPCSLAIIPDHFKTQKMLDKAVEEDLYSLEFVPDHLKIEKMCEKAVEEVLYTLRDVPDHLKTQKMCEKAVEEDPYRLRDAPDHLKTQKMCDAVVMKDLLLLRYVPDCFFTQQQIKLRDDRLIGWYEGYKKWKAQKALIKEELLPIAWYPSRYWDWCVPEDEKKETEKLWP